jgi:hypothetical protein
MHLRHLIQSCDLVQNKGAITLRLNDLDWSSLPAFGRHIIFRISKVILLDQAFPSYWSSRCETTAEVMSLGTKHSATQNTENVARGGGMTTAPHRDYIKHLNRVKNLSNETNNDVDSIYINMDLIFSPRR